MDAMFESHKEGSRGMHHRRLISFILYMQSLQRHNANMQSCHAD